MLEAIEASPDRWAHGAGLGRADARLGGALRAADRALRDARTPAPSGCWASTARAAASQVPNGFDPELFAPASTVDRGAQLGREHVPDARRGYEGAGAALRRALHRGQARAAADRGLRAGAAALPRSARRSCSSAASRTSARASTRWTRSRARARRTSSSPAGTSTTSCRDILAAADVVVLPSVREQFGQVLVEGMACGLPAIAVDAHGPAEIVDARRDRLAGASPTTATGSPTRWWRRSTTPRSAAAAASRAARGRAERYAWPALAERVAEVYETALRGG